MASGADLRRLALAMAGTEEAPHMDRAAFRVARIYATLAADGLSANLKFSPEDQALKCMTHPEAFSPVPGGWGRMGHTTVLLAVTEEELAAALETAWRGALPRRRPPGRARRR
ncbi:MmcQ/YjbR family DNA-binding protein [Roseomonas populi]|uniref:MmcQ/YjbR family DNA-binding protein n=1 Tax=Roseomonas populi TaxID=3121582 RepID=A0ABT1X3Z5_9PROT|nr:MmcQ/YjbR family DNA-binding protein [Roseomonas pecuniae]MCR0981694.1 MmcQ/YjbR family DNA-binding protein [Roseomonas pecuniae]